MGNIQGFLITQGGLSCEQFFHEAPTLVQCLHLFPATLADSWKTYNNTVSSECHLGYLFQFDPVRSRFCGGHLPTFSDALLSRIIALCLNFVLAGDVSIFAQAAASFYHACDFLSTCVADVTWKNV